MQILISQLLITRMDGWIMVIMELLFTEQACYFFATKLEAQLWTNKSHNSQTQEPLSFGYSCMQYLIFSHARKHKKLTCFIST